MRALLPVVASVAMACGGAPPEAAPAAAAPSPERSASVAGPPQTPAELQRIAGDAMNVPRISPVAHYAPQLCAADVSHRPGPTLSNAGDPSAHAKKVFFLRTRDAKQYADIATGKAAAPDDFFVVKEAYSTNPEGGQGPSAGLFVAWRASGSWRFGTVSPDGVASTEGEATCAGCHATQTRTGLFGPG